MTDSSVSDSPSKRTIISVSSSVGPCMDTDSAFGASETTTVSVTCTGKVRTAVGAGRITYTFRGRTLREYLDSFFDYYPVEELVMAGNPEEEQAPGWAPRPDTLPGTWAANPPGERTRRFARLTVNGTFNEHLDDLDTVLQEGDRVGLLNPFIYCV